jgi:hypothetical protein
LIIGIVVGVLANDRILGRLAPDFYERTFVGGLTEREDLRGLEARQNAERERARQRRQEMDAEIADLEKTGVTPAAIEEKRAQDARELDQIDNESKRNDDWRGFYERYDQSRRRQAAKLGGYRTALILAMLAIMAIEALIDPLAADPWPRWRARLASVRYAFLAAWIALVLAQPEPLVPVPYQLVGLLIVVGLVAAWVPLGRRGA